MIAITNDAGLDLLLELDQRATLEQAVGWLSDDQLPGAKSYPIGFPVAPNEAFLASGYRPDAARPQMEIVVQVRLTGVMFRRCRLNYRVVDGKGSGYLKFDGGDVFSQLRKLTLQQAISDVLTVGTGLFSSLVSRMNDIARLPLGQSPFTFFPIRNEGFFEDNLDTSIVTSYVKQPYVNAWQTGSFVVDTDQKRGYPASPQFFLWWVLERIFAKAGYRIEGDWLSQEETQRLVILNQTAISAFGTGLVNIVKAQIKPARHLPKMSVGDFLKAIRQGFGLILTFDSNRQVVTIRQFNDVVRSRAVDLTPYLAGAYGIDPAANSGLTIIDAIDSADNLYRSGNGQPVEPTKLVLGGTDDEGRTEVKLAIAGTQQTFEPAPDGGYWSVPILLQAGNTLDANYARSDRYPSRETGQSEPALRNDIALRIISYRGLAATSQGALYPLGSSDVLSGAQQPVGRLATKLTGRQGRYRQLLRSLLYFRDQTRSVTVPLDLPVGVLTGLKLHEPIALKLSGQARRSYLIDKLQAESPGPSGIMRAKLTCLTLPDGIDLGIDVDDPLVYVELVRGPKRNQTVPVLVDGRPATTNRTVVDLTLAVWADATRSRAVVVVNLPVNLRVYRYQIYNGPGAQPTYTEGVKPYLVNGTTTLIETDYLLVQGDTSVLSHVYINQDVQLDPGDDYLILV